jgi:hypothetical protein
MNSPAVDVISLLAANNLIDGQTGWAGRVSREPDMPDQCITVYDTGGYAPFGYGAEQPTVQVRIRGGLNYYPTTYAKAKEIRDLLENQENIIINQTEYDAFELMGDLTSLGYDERSRPIFVCNFRLIRKDVS